MEPNNACHVACTYEHGHSSRIIRVGMNLRSKCFKKLCKTSKVARLLNGYSFLTHITNKKL